MNTFSDRGKSSMLTLYKSLIRSHLENGCPLWSPQNMTEIRALEMIQKNFISKISGMYEMNYWEKLKALNLQSLQRRRERYCIIHMWKILNNTAPNDLNIGFHYNSRRGTKASLKPVIKANSRFQTKHDNSFVHVGPSLWNLLPKEVNTETSLPSFKVALSNFLDRYPDNPPVHGLSYINDNSLLSYPLFL